MKVKTRELAGKALDWAVMKIERSELLTGSPDNPIDRPLSYTLRYSTDWAQGGPITVRERISIHYCTDLRNGNRRYIHAHIEGNVSHGYWWGDHSHPLIAAMRCHVAAHEGDEVDVPEELLS